MEHIWITACGFQKCLKKTFNTVHFNDCCKLNISFENKPAAIWGIFDAFPLSGTMKSQNMHTPWLLWRQDSFYFIKRNKKQQQSNNIGLRTIYSWKISFMLRAGMLLSKGNLSVRDFFLSGRTNNEESLKQNIKYYSHTQYLIYIFLQ